MTNAIQAFNSFGNTDILSLNKTVFLCSRSYPAKAVLRIYDWAKTMRDSGQCVVSSFHSRLERDVLDILLRGEQPLILVVARGLPKHYNPDIRKAIDNERLLVLSPFPETVKQITTETAQKRNEFILSIADSIVVGHADKNGGISQALKNISADKKVTYLAE